MSDAADMCTERERGREPSNIMNPHAPQNEACVGRCHIETTFGWRGFSLLLAEQQTHSRHDHVEMHVATVCPEWYGKKQVQTTASATRATEPREKRGRWTWCASCHPQPFGRDRIRLSPLDQNYFGQLWLAVCQESLLHPPLRFSMLPRS